MTGHCQWSKKKEKKDGQGSLRSTDQTNSGFPHTNDKNIVLNISTATQRSSTNNVQKLASFHPVAEV